MQEQLMKVVFKGEVLIGQDVDLVKQNLAERFKLSSRAIEQLFSGKSVTIKKDIERTKALKYRDAFREAGAICHIEWMNPEYINKNMALPSENVTRIVTCPKCGKKQQQEDNCEACGYALKPSVHHDHNFATLFYDSLRERGIPKWAIITGLCVVFFGLIVPMFIPKGSAEIPKLHVLNIADFPNASAPGGFNIYRWNFGHKKKMQYDFEQIYKKGSSLNAYNPSTDQAHNQAQDPLSISGKIAGRLTLQSFGEGDANIDLTDCQRTEKYGMSILNSFSSGGAEETPDIQVRQLQENGRIQSPVSSNCAYLHLLFRMPESIQQIGESETYEIQMNYQGQQLQGIGEVSLDNYVIVDNQRCAKLIHEIQLNSENNDSEKISFEIIGTVTSFFGLENRQLYLGQLQQTITKNTYEMYEGFYTWLATSQDETITFMKKGLAGKLEVEEE